MNNNLLALAALAVATLSLNTAIALADTEKTPAQLTVQEDDAPKLGVFVEIDAALMAVMKQSNAIQAGVTYGPFRAGLTYETFLSNNSLGGTPKGFDMRVNYIYGLNAAYFIGQKTDRGFYLNGMLHIKQQGVTNQENGAHTDLDSVAVGVELGYLWKIYKGFYIEPRVGALYYVNKPQPGNDPVDVGGRMYDNARHKNWDTYYIPTLSVGYSWK